MTGGGSTGRPPWVEGSLSGTGPPRRVATATWNGVVLVVWLRDVIEADELGEAGERGGVDAVGGVFCGRLVAGWLAWAVEAR